jgi:hypothetical protein
MTQFRQTCEKRSPAVHCGMWFRCDVSGVDGQFSDGWLVSDTWFIVEGNALMLVTCVQSVFD